MYFPTPVGKSYVCDKEQSVLLYAPDGTDDLSGHIARLYLRDLHMQSFMFKESGKWGPPFHCSATGSYRDETAPLAVGTALAIATFLVLVGYGAWRWVEWEGVESVSLKAHFRMLNSLPYSYFKIKKVQYGSME